MDFFPDESLCRHQFKLSTANHINDHLFSPASKSEYLASELNINFDIQNRLIETHLYIFNLPGNSIRFNAINRNCSLREDLVFHTIFEL